MPARNSLFNHSKITHSNDVREKAGTEEQLFNALNRPEFISGLADNFQGMVDSVTRFRNSRNQVTVNLRNAPLSDDQVSLRSEWKLIEEMSQVVVSRTKDSTTDLGQQFKRFRDLVLPIVSNGKLPNSERILSPEQTLVLLNSHVTLAKKRSAESSDTDALFTELLRLTTTFHSKFSHHTSDDIQHIEDSLSKVQKEASEMKTKIILLSCLFVGSASLITLCYAVTLFNLPGSHFMAPLETLINDRVLKPSAPALRDGVESFRSKKKEKSEIKRKLRALNPDAVGQTYMGLHEVAVTFMFAKDLWENYIKQLEELQAYVSNKIHSQGNESVAVPFAITQFKKTEKSQYDFLIEPLSNYAQCM